MESKHEKEFLFIKSIKTLLAPIHTVHSLSASGYGLYEAGTRSLEFLRMKRSSQSFKIILF